MRNNRTSVTLLWSLLTSAVCADLKPFREDSLNPIEADHKGQPLVIMLCSLDCRPCLEELRALQKLGKRIPPRRLVLIATDGGEHREELGQILARFDMADRKNRVFADACTERLRHRIDANWFGELLRSYFYDAELRRTAKSGVLSRKTLNQWLLPDASIRNVL